MTFSSTIDHLHTINQLIEKAQKCNKPLCLAFVDNEKAFDSLEHTAVFNSMPEQGINENYIEVIRSSYENGTSIISLHKEIRIAKGVRQGDTISPKLFTATL